MSSIVSQTLSDYFPFAFKRPAPRFVSVSGAAVHGVMAEFATPADVTHAAERIRDAGYTKWDVHTPFPVHGLDEAMGVKRTILPVLVAAGAFTGVGCSALMQYFMNYWDYFLVVHGKSDNAWEPFVPVLFELGVLFAAFTTIIGMFAMNGLPRWNHPLLGSERFLRASDDRFIVCIESSDPKFDPARARELLERLGGAHVELVEDPS